MVSPDSGGHGEGETPLPIPNRAVKPLSADGTWPARARESRTPPVICWNGSPSGGPFCVVGPVARARPRASRLGSAPWRSGAPAAAPRVRSERATSSALAELDGWSRARSARPSTRSTSTCPTDPAARREYERRLVGHPGFLAPSSARAAGCWAGFSSRSTTGAPASSSSATACTPTRGARATPPRAPRRCCATRSPARGSRACTPTRCSSNPGSIRVMEKIGMTYAGPWDYRGLPGAEYEASLASAARGRRARRLNDRGPLPMGGPDRSWRPSQAAQRAEGCALRLPRMRPLGRDAAMGPRGDRPGAPGPHRCAQGRAVRMGRGERRRDRAGSRSRRPHPRRRTRGRGRWCSSRAWRRRRPGRRRAGRSRAMKTRPAGGSRQGRTCVREPRPGVGRKRGAASELAGRLASGGAEPAATRSCPARTRRRSSCARARRPRW